MPAKTLDELYFSKIKSLAGSVTPHSASLTKPNTSIGNTVLIAVFPEDTFESPVSINNSIIFVMKKIIHLSAVAILAISIGSCSKTSSGYLSSITSAQQSTASQPVKVRIFSDWQSLVLNPETINGNIQLVGQSTLTQIVSYEMGMHKQLAYTRYPGRNSFVYRLLPMEYLTPLGNHAFNFSLDFSTFKVFISNPNQPGRLVAAQDLSRFNYRYIVIPIEVYQATQVDWNNLPAVAAALNFTL